MRVRTAAEVDPRGRRGSSSVEESEGELGGRLARAAAFFGAGALGAALPLGRPRGRFTGASVKAGSGVSLIGGSTEGARVNGAGASVTRSEAAGGGLSASWALAGASWSSVCIGSRTTSI